MIYLQGSNLQEDSSLQQRKDRGFTLIELVIVITLLGILAATALPKFANLTQQAYSAANSGSGGAFSSALNIAHAAWIAAGASNAAGGTTVTLDCATPNNVHVTTNGWPDNAVACGGTAAAGTAGTPTTAECAAIWNNIVNNPAPATTAADCTGLNSTTCYLATSAANTCIFTLMGANTITPTRSVTYTLTTGNVQIVSP